MKLDRDGLKRLIVEEAERMVGAHPLEEVGRMSSPLRGDVGTVRSSARRVIEARYDETLAAEDRHDGLRKRADRTPDLLQVVH